MAKAVRNKVYIPGEIDFTFSDLGQRKEPEIALMCTPEFFDVVDVKNVHMEGKTGLINKKLAMEQWSSIGQIYRYLVMNGELKEYAEIEGAQGCEDMVFAANQSFPWITKDGRKLVILSKMRHESRQAEVPFFREFYRKRGYEILELKKPRLFEGMGDAIPHPDRYLIYGGYGHRTELQAYSEISEILETPVIPLELVNEKFYHLDTCFLPLDEKTVLIFEGAFSDAGKKAIGKMFPEVLTVPEDEAADNFALNAHLVRGRKGGKAAIIQKGSAFTNNVLREKGFQVYETDTSEYLKSGGSVFCMKMMIY